MIRRIDHVAIAVRDLDRARDFFVSRLGGRELESAAVSSEGFRWTTIELGSSCMIELIDPVGDDGFLQRFLARHGEGVHHVTIQVHDIRSAEHRLRAAGVPIFGAAEKSPAWKEFFVHPRDAFGVLLQFAEFDIDQWLSGDEVPAPYREFAAERVRPVTLSEHSGPDGGAIIELSNGIASLRVDRRDIPDLIRRLERLATTTGAGG